MWLVLCTANDIGALWAARGLAARGLQPLEIITSEALAYNKSLTHRLGTGQSTINITLADGRTIDGATVRGTLNRLQFIPGSHLRTANLTDRRYAEQELFALYLSLLHALPGTMLNRPTPHGLCGDWRHPSEWVWLAHRAGLLTMQYQQSELLPAPPLYDVGTPASKTTVVVKGECCGLEIPPDVAGGCSRLSELSETPLLGCDFDLTPAGEWRFVRATPLPDLQKGGEQLRDALARALNP